jgi:hypothetical protein
VQVMLMKVLAFWKVLSPASKPRAIWVIVHYLKLPAIQERCWESLMEALRELLLYQPLATTEMHTQVRSPPAASPANSCQVASATTACTHSCSLLLGFLQIWVPATCF